LGKSSDFYWIGGTGNWSDTLHWYSVTGGLPDSADNVFFDMNSFSSPDQEVIIDTAVYCHNMDWSLVSNQPFLSGTDDMYISGSFILSQEMTLNFTGNIYFTSGETGQLIQLNGNIINSPVIFDGTGTWILADDFNNSQKSISLINGFLNLSGKTLRCGSFISTGGSNKSLNIESSEVFIQASNGSWNVDNQLNLLSDYSTLIFVQNNYSAINLFHGGNKVYFDLILNNDAIITGNNSFRNVYLNPEHNYRLASGSTQTINGSLTARGCAGPMRISATGSNQAMIAKNNGDIRISSVALHSIKGIVSAPYQFDAVNCIDEGNNQGINIYMQYRNMYWINGSGNWSDTAHWTSLPVNEDSDCIPQDIDNVYFNEASFDGTDTVNVDINEIRCNNMFWSGNDQPVFKNSPAISRISIYGSLQFMTSMQNNFDKPVFFCDTLNGQTITSAGQKFNSDLYFTGKQGGWTLIDSLDVNGKIHFLQGNLNTNNNYLSCLTFQSDSAFVRSLNIGNSEIKIKSSYNGYSWRLNTDSLQFYSGSSNIEIIAASGTLYQYGGDTVIYHNVLFSGITGIARLFTNNDTYAMFHHVAFKSNASIFSNNSFDTLSFSPGNFYDFASGKTQTINDQVFPTGECNGPILIKAATNGSLARIKSDNDTLLINYSSIRDIHTAGESVFIAENSVDLGNNIGWDTIMVTAPGKLYWVGGTGEWNDPMHWSLISGGSGGECIPTPYDTVIFDQNSFTASDQYSRINLNNAFAHNMDWSAAGFVPDFKGTSNGAYLRIYGSLKLNPLMNFTYPAYIWFESSDSNEIIITEGIKFNNVNNNVYFDGIGGKWSLMDSLQLGSSKTNQNCIFFNNGNINSNNQYIDCFSFYSTLTTPRTLSPGTSEIKIQNDWYFNGMNLSLTENQSIIQIDSGRFVHISGNYFPYHNVYFNHSYANQVLYTNNADSVLFNDVIFHTSNGKAYGSNGSVYGHSLLFEGAGQINETNDANSNIYIIDSLDFKSSGIIYGNDTVRNFVKFDSVGTIIGNGEYVYAQFINDGNIFGNNSFDTLIFTPTHSYQLGSQDIQTVVDSFSIMGNNCQSIILYASSDLHAVVYKDTGSVFGDFIEMTAIKATGNAVFDAGKFSTNVDNSNEGWLFHDSPLNFSLGPDISILEGETVYLCAENFNGNSTTTYEWSVCETGEILGTDSCMLFSQKGHYCLSVYYTEGGGCIKTDDIYVGCHLDLAFDTTHVSCNGFADGSIEMEIITGLGPFDINWYYNGNWISSAQNIYDLIAGHYIYSISDTEECMSTDTVTVHEPESLQMNSTSFPACYEVLNGAITLEVSGGTEPYQYYWSNGSVNPELTGIAPGIYDITVTDDHLCPPISKSVIVTELPELIVNLNGTDLNCYHDGSGSIEANEVTGGSGIYAVYEWLKDTTYYTGSPNIGDLMAGTYTLRVTDDYGCIGINSIMISEPDEIILELTGDSNIETQGSAYLNVSGGVPPYTYLWNNGATTEDISYLQGGNYVVTVTDSHSCSFTDSIFVYVHYKIFAPTAFSPNGDGVNEEFVFFEVGTDLEEMDMVIFNRAGQKVFQTTDIKNYWNGKLNNSGNPCPIEVYTWFAKLTFTNGESLVYKGNVSLLR